MVMHNLICSAVLKAFSIFPINKNKVIFCSYFGTKYADSPRMITEALSQYKDIKIVWVLNKGIQPPTGVKVVRRKSLSYFYEYATAKCWVDNSRKPIWFVKRKKQYYIQTWHCGIGLKKSERYSETTLTPEYIRSAKHDSNMVDLFLSSSVWLTNLYHDCFWYNGKVLQIGLPREDQLLAPKYDYHKLICRYYNISDDTKFLLYAPTFRDDGDISCYDIALKKILTFLQEKTGSVWKAIVRLHPNIANRKDIISYDDQILNGSDYQEINDLILSCSLFISDYSSCMFDAALAGKPTLLYVPDYEKYYKTRGLLFPLDQLPFESAKSTEELIYRIKSFDDKEYEHNVRNFFSKCGMVYNPNSARDIAKYIRKQILKK